MSIKWNARRTFIATFSLLIIVCVVAISCREKQGIATSLGKLPYYGDRFVDIPVHDLRYSYFPSTGRLYAKGRIRAGDFLKLRQQLGVDPLYYGDGPIDAVVRNPRFNPTNGPVYLIEKRLYTEGRAIARLYLQPTSKRQSSDGTLFVQIVN